MQTLGIIDIAWRGQNLPCEKGATLKDGGFKQNTVITGRTVNFAQEFQAGEVKATVALGRGQSFAGLFTPGQGELQAICDTGQTLVWPDAFLQEPPQATGGEGGKIELTWIVGKAQELLNG